MNKLANGGHLRNVLPLKRNREKIFLYRYVLIETISSI